MNFANNWIILSAFIALSSSIETRKYSPRWLSLTIALAHTRSPYLCGRGRACVLGEYVRFAVLRVQIFRFRQSNRWDCICSLSLLAACVQTIFLSSFLANARAKREERKKLVSFYAPCVVYALVFGVWQFNNYSRLGTINQRAVRKK